MRQFFVAASGLLISSFFLASTTSAQDMAYVKTTPKPGAHTLLAESYVHENSIPKTTIDANLKLQKSFNYYFKNAANVNWYNVKKDFLVQFENNGRKTRALFGKNGYIYYAITHGNESSLPKDIRRSVKSMYYDFNILNVWEIKSGAVDHITWLVQLKDDKNMVMARVIDGGVDEYARYDNEPRVKTQRKGRIIIPKS